MRAIISGVGHYTPERKLTNKDLEETLDTDDEWITTRTGIKERRLLDQDKGTSYMAVKAAEAVLEQADVSASQIDMILVATTTPDMLFPSTASIVQNELKAQNCWGFDLVAGCSGFVFALATASQFIETGRHKKILVIGADKMSSIIDYDDRNSCILFGDGAGAILMEPSNDDELGVQDFMFHTDGSGGRYLYMEAGGSLYPATHETVEKKMHYLVQDGKTVFKYAVTEMTETSKKLMEKNGMTHEDINLLIPHQANQRIIDSVAEKLSLRKDQVVSNIEKYGNTTAGTIPIAMSEAYKEGRISKGDQIIISAFGTGFSWGSLLFKWAFD
jgi:3-oxoacyl-[acyl-carrier-protein] synthase-3